VRDQELEQAKLGRRDLRANALAIDPYVLCILVEPETLCWGLWTRAGRVAVYEIQPANPPKLDTIAVVQAPRVGGNALTIDSCTIMAVEVFQNI
jgi:hypothetical protein